MVTVIPDREVHTTEVVDASGPSTTIVVMFSLLIIAALGFMIYYFSNTNMANSNLPTTNTIIERNTSTNTTTPVPIPTPMPAPVAPAAPAEAPATP